MLIFYRNELLPNLPADNPVVPSPLLPSSNPSSLSLLQSQPHSIPRHLVLPLPSSEAWRDFHLLMKKKKINIVD